MRQFVEVSHPIVEGMVTYPGLPAPTVDVLMDYDASRSHYNNEAEFFIASLHLCGNTGTYVDSPRHRYRQGADLSMLPLESIAELSVVVADARQLKERAIGPELLSGREFSGKAVLFHTGWSRHFGTDAYNTGHPYLTAATCERLLAGGARFVGIDSLNIDDTANGARPAHTILLGAGVPVCEHLTNLDQLRREGGRLHAVPLAWVGGATLPVRAYVVYED